MAARLDLVGVRALAVHAVVDEWSVEGVAEALRRATRRAREAARLLGELLDVEPWTLRVTLPPAPLGGEEASRVVSEAVEAAGLDPGVLYSVLHLDAASLEPGHVLRVLGSAPNVYASAATPVATERAAVLAAEVAAAGPDRAARFAVTVPGHVETAYFPAGASLGSTTGLSASLLYPRLLEGRNLYAAFDDLADAAAALEDALMKTADRLGLEYRGIDLSLSPWMDESAARVVEEAAGGACICEPAAAAAVAEIEELIEDTCLDIECTGFNQVMLPPAEDNVLKERAAQGALDASLLLSLSHSCVAGLDMAVLPRTQWGREEAHAAVAVLAVASRHKSKPLGLRVIAVDKQPGDRVELPRFGETPVIPYSIHREAWRSRGGAE